MNRRVLPIVGLQAALVVAYLVRFPVFPEFQSADFLQHVDHASTWPPNGPMLFYGEAATYLSLVRMAIPFLQPMMAERYAMGLLVVFSPIIVYKLAKEMAPEHASFHWFSSLIWVISGAVWFGMVFDSGLYANFFGVLASMVLGWSTLRLLRRETPTFSGLFWFVIALAFAAFSHYSILEMFPAVLGLLLWKGVKDEKVRMKATLAVETLILPLLAAFAVFPDLASLLVATATETAPPDAIVVASTPLARVIPVPVLSYMVAELDGPFLVDLVPLLFAGFALYFLTLKRNYRLNFFLGWFSTILVTSPLNSTAWRYSFVALAPLIFISSYGLGDFWFKVYPYSKTRNKFPYLVSGPSVSPLKGAIAACVCLVLLISIPTSWGLGNSGVASSTDSLQFASTDYADLHALQWLKSFIPNVTCYRGLNADIPATCEFATLTDWRLTYSSVLNGPNVVLLHPSPLPTPETTEGAMAAQGIKFLFVTSTDLIPPPLCVSPEILNVLVLKTGSTWVQIKATSDPRMNATDGRSQVYIDGLPYGQFAFQDGRATLNLTEIARGSHTLGIGYEFTFSNTVTVDLGGASAPDYHRYYENTCEPWGWNELSYGQGATLVYNETGVELWQLSQ